MSGDTLTESAFSSEFLELNALLSDIARHSREVDIVPEGVHAGVRNDTYMLDIPFDHAAVKATPTPVTDVTDKPDVTAHTASLPQAVGDSLRQLGGYASSRPLAGVEWVRLSG